MECQFSWNVNTGMESNSNKRVTSLAFIKQVQGTLNVKCNCPIKPFLSRIPSKTNKPFPQLCLTLYYNKQF